VVEPSHSAATEDGHFRKLERLYRAAPINEYFAPRLAIGHGTAIIDLDVRPEFFHAASAVHGTVYFKLLDDASFFAAASLVEDFFILTATFTVTFLRPVHGGRMRAEGRATGSEGRRLFAEATIQDEQGAEVARGQGVFVRSKIPLSADLGYG